MKRLLVFMSMLIVSFCLVFSQAVFKYTKVCRPGTGAKLYADEYYQIQWCQSTKMSGTVTFSLLEKTTDPGATFIELPGFTDTTVPNTGIFIWQVPGDIGVVGYKYKIKIDTGESGIFEIIGGSFSVSYFKNFERFNEGFVWLPRSKPDPKCPGCGTLDIGKLLDTVSPPAGKQVRLAIYRGGKLVTKLGNFGEKSRLPRTLNVRFSKEDYKAMKKGGRVFELRVMNMKGKLLHSQKIPIKMKQERKGDR